MADEQPQTTSDDPADDAAEQEQRRELGREQRGQRLQGSARAQSAPAPQPQDVAADAAGMVSNPWVTLGFKLARALGLPKWLTGRKFEIFLRYIFPILLVFIAVLALAFIVVYVYELVKGNALGNFFTQVTGQ